MGFGIELSGHFTPNHQRSCQPYPFWGEIPLLVITLHQKGKFPRLECAIFHLHTESLGLHHRIWTGSHIILIHTAHFDCFPVLS